MKKLVIVIFLLLPMFIYCQNPYEMNLSITDTVIIAKKLIKKKVKKSYIYAIKVNAEINAPNMQDSLFLYSFNKYVSSFSFFNNYIKSNLYKEISVGLMYVIEDKNNQIIIPAFELVSYKKEKDLIRNSNSRIFVSPKLRIIRRLLTEQEQRDYDLAKHVIDSKKQSLELFPLLGEYHNNLPKGEYYLYFVYSYHSNALPIGNIADDSRTFRGYFVSNKVKLIVE